MTIVEFLSARLDEDEAAAERARDGGSGAWTNYGDDVGEGLNSSVVERVTTGEALEHVARHAPARVLREVEAKRRALNRHSRCGTGVGYCDDGGHGEIDESDRGYGCPDLADLASACAEHPNYDTAWRRKQLTTLV